MIKKMERPELVDYKDEIHHPNGFIEDRYMHNEYVEDLEKYVDYLEYKLKNNGDLGDVSGSLPSLEEDISFLEEYNLHPHVNQELKILTEDSEGAHLCKEDIIKLIDVLIRYVYNKR